jgi:hypothetical protein
LNGRRASEVDERAEDSRRPAAERADSALRVHEAQRKPQGAEYALGHLVQPHHPEHAPTRQRPWAPGVGLGGLGLTGLVEEEPNELQRRQSVDHAVVGLAHEPDATVGKLGEPHLPQRAVALEVRGHRLVHDRGDVGALGPHHVASEVEVRVVHPRGLPGAQRKRDEPLAIARRVGEAPGDVVAKLLEGGARALGRRGEGGQPPHVHVHVRILDREERGIGGRQLLEHAA